MADADDSKYPIGYKKPPRYTQFTPGLSGNIKGRPKGAKNFTTVFEEELRVPIEVTINGKRKRISKRQAIVKQTVNRAVAGDPKATSILLNEARARQSQNQPPVAQSAFVSPEEQVVMDHIVQRIRHSEPTSLGSECRPDLSREDQPTPPTQSNEGDL